MGAVDCSIVRRNAGIASILAKGANANVRVIVCRPISQVPSCAGNSLFIAPLPNSARLWTEASQQVQVRTCVVVMLRDPFSLVAIAPVGNVGHTTHRTSPRSLPAIWLNEHFILFVAGEVRGQLVGLERTQQIDGLLICLLAVEPTCVILQVHDDRHAFVDGLHQFVRVHGVDGIALQPVASVRVLRCSPQTSGGERLMILQRNLELGIDLLPILLPLRKNYRREPGRDAQRRPGKRNPATGFKFFRR